MRQVTKEHFQQTCLETPFHPRTSALCETNCWGNWMGYTVPNSFINVEVEYFAIRNAAGIFDLTPMNKYRITGPDALAYMDRLVTRNMTKLKPGRVGYAMWCNDRGQVIDDGTIFHLEEGVYRLCAQEHQLEWLHMSAIGFDVTIEDETHDVTGLAFQGPLSCVVLKNMGLTGIENLKPFGIATFPFEGGELMVSRTGFTGDLGYELWVKNEHALALWDQLFAAGKHYDLRPIGSDALEMARIEAGFIAAGVDFMPALHTIRSTHTRTPLELGMEWLVDFTKPNFTGRKALLEQKEKGPRYNFAILDIEGNKPAGDAYVYLGKNGKEVGTVTTAAWSPVCKANIALATIEAPYGKPGDDLWVEVYYQREMHWNRLWCKATVLTSPPWNPPRRRATPPADF